MIQKVRSKMFDVTTAEARDAADNQIEEMINSDWVVKYEELFIKFNGEAYLFVRFEITLSDNPNDDECVIW